jgi:hypothetical protein
MKAPGVAAVEGECNESLRSRARSDRGGLGGHSVDGKRRSGKRDGAVADCEGMGLAGGALEGGRECVGAWRAERVDHSQGERRPMCRPEWLRRPRSRRDLDRNAKVRRY